MLETISPYALLCASKPKQPESVITSYDLYSAAQMPMVSREILSTNTTNVPNVSPIPDAVPAPQTRTHYISDIHARHCKANSLTRMQPPHNIR